MVLGSDEMGLILELISRQPILPLTQQKAILNLQRRVTEHVAQLTDPRCEAYRHAADERWAREGEIEVDESAVVSEGDDNGAYVQAWVWVYTHEAGLPAKLEEDEGEEEVAA